MIIIIIICYMLSGRVMIISLTVGLIKKKDIVQIYILCNISQYFPKPYSGSIGHVKVERDLSNYATRAHLKEATGADIFNLAA